jgi:hypothetical protein
MVRGSVQSAQGPGANTTLDEDADPHHVRALKPLTSKESATTDINLSLNSGSELHTRELQANELQPSSFAGGP